MALIARNHGRHHLSHDPNQACKVYVCHRDGLIGIPVRGVKGPVDTRKENDTINVTHSLSRRNNAVVICDVDSLVSGTSGQL